MGVRQSFSSADDDRELQNNNQNSEIVTLKPVSQRQVRALHRHQKKNLRCRHQCTPPPPPPSPAVSTPTSTTIPPTDPCGNSSKKKKEEEKKEAELDQQRERIHEDYDDFRRFLPLNEKDTSLCLTVTTITAEKIIETRPKDFVAPCDSDGEEDEDAGWAVLSKTPLPERKRKTFRFDRYACHYHEYDHENSVGDEKDQNARRQYFTQCRQMGPSDGFQCIKRWNPQSSTWEWDKETRDFQHDEGLVLAIRETGDTSISQDGPSFTFASTATLDSRDDEAIFDGITNFECIPETYNSSYHQL